MVHGVRNMSLAKSTLGHCFNEIRKSMWHLVSMSILSIKRKFNIPAHELSKLGIVAEDSCIWYADVPLSILVAVIADFSS